tara:strand:+ start:166 stop:351 length:186 start_codon:yes stop_codon:yes gene_type:complete
MEKKNKTEKKCPISWSKRIAYMGFWFFLFKGIAWLFGLAAIYIWGADIFDNIQNFILGSNN